MSTLRIPGPVEVATTVATGHDALYVWAQDMVTDGAFSANAGADIIPPFNSLSATVIQRVKFQWTPPIHWEAFVGRLGFLYPEVIGGGNIRFRWKHAQIGFAENPTEALVTVGDVTVANPAAAGQAWSYIDLAGSEASPVALTGGIVNTVIDRFATDAADTAPGLAGVLLATMTRV